MLLSRHKLLPALFLLGIGSIAASASPLVWVGDRDSASTAFAYSAILDASRLSMPMMTALDLTGTPGFALFFGSSLTSGGGRETASCGDPLVVLKDRSCGL